MKNFNLIRLMITGIVYLCMTTSISAQSVYQESGGYVVMEMEKGSGDRQNCWLDETDNNPEGGMAWRANCNNTSSGPPQAPLTWDFQINTAGTYTLFLKIWKDHHLTGDEADKSNDVYVKVAGDYTSGGNASLDMLTTDTKLYGGSSNNYAWTGKNSSLDRDHQKWNAHYNFKAGERYTLTISGRAKNAVLDRILFATVGGESEGKANGTPESSTGVGPDATCSDGILNQDETEIDCGGICDACVQPTCSDGIKNGDETGIDCGGTCTACIVTGEPITYSALGDFTIVEGTGEFVTYYEHPAENALAIDAAVESNREKFAAATITFDGADGSYDFNLTGLRETDGETTYRIYVNGTQVGTDVQNDRITSEPDYTPQVHTIEGVVLVNGDVIRIESDVHSNGLIPEGNAFAWARGRWTQLELVPSSVVPVEELLFGWSPSFNYVYNRANREVHFIFEGLNPALDSRFSLFDVDGKEILNIEAHSGSFTWNGSDVHGKIVSTGVYFSILKSGNTTVVKKLYMF